MQTFSPGGPYGQAYPSPIASSSGAVVAAQAVATLTAVAGKTTWIEGFDLVGTGATGTSVISVVVSGLLGGSVTIGVNIPAGATVILNAGSPNGVQYRFPTPLPASAQNVNIVVTVPSFGTGNLFANVTAYGFNA